METIINIKQFVFYLIGWCSTTILYLLIILVFIIIGHIIVSFIFKVYKNSIYLTTVKLDDIHSGIKEEVYVPTQNTKQ